MNILKNFLKFSLLFLFLAAGFLSGCGSSEDYFQLDENEESLQSSEEEEPGEGIPENENQEDTGDEIYVYICGEVMQPGVYTLKEGSRVYELVNMAGGFTAGASRVSINQAQLLTDGQQIYIPPSSGGDGDSETAKAAETGTDGSVNINTADIATLTNLPGIGEQRAADIIAYRESNGSFKTIEDIKKVSGIKDGLFLKIKDRISI